MEKITEMDLMQLERQSCPYIEGGLVFQNHGFTACCSVRHGHDWPLLYPYTKNDTQFPINAVLSQRNEIRNQNYEGVYPNCQGCRTLSKQKWVEKKYYFDLISVQNDLRCNIVCEYCNFLVKWKDYEKDYQVYKLYPLLKELVENQWLSPKSKIFWAGGEPSILDEFVDCLNLLFQYSADIQLQIATNATTLPNGLVEVCQKYGRNITVLCSLDCGSRDVYLRVKQKDYYDLVIENLRRYTGLIKTVIIKMIITQSNFTDVDAFISVAKDLGILHVLFDVDCTQNMRDIPTQYLQAIVDLKFKALSCGIIASPASLWEFYDIVCDRLEAIQQATYLKLHQNGQIMSKTVRVTVIGKNDLSYASEACILNIGSEVQPVASDWSFAEKGHLVRKDGSAPMGRCMIMTKIDESIDVELNGDKLFIMVNFTKWGGVIQVSFAGIDYQFDLFAEQAECKMISIG